MIQYKFIHTNARTILIELDRSLIQEATEQFCKHQSLNDTKEHNNTIYLVRFEYNIL